VCSLYRLQLTFHEGKNADIFSDKALDAVGSAVIMECGFWAAIRYLASLIVPRWGILVGKVR